MKLININDVNKLIKTHGFIQFITDLTTYLKEDFTNWYQFKKSSRHATHFTDGVIELMPIANDKYYSFKYVNGHPNNPLQNKQTVVATGQLSCAINGYPLMFSEMTILTALRTAATSMLASKYLSNPKSKTLAIIGTGAQSEFQTLTHLMIRNIETIKYYDIDPKAMDKYENNMQHLEQNLQRCNNAKDAVLDADIVIVCTACKGHVDVIKSVWINPGTHINALGGDCPGKTELELELLLKSQIIVEYLPQSKIEGEIQLLNNEMIDNLLLGELWQILNHDIEFSYNNQIITIFDSVGFALEDYSILRLVYDLSNKYKIGEEIDFIPPLKDPKNLITIINYK
jgi:ornithine cyclodeaminase